MVIASRATNHSSFETRPGVVLYLFSVVICGASMRKEYYLVIRGARSNFSLLAFTRGAGFQKKICRTDLNCRISR